MSFSNALEDSTLNRVFRNISTPLTPPYPPLDLALWIGNPGEDGSGGVEVSFFTGGVENGYARKITSLADWTTASGGVVTNAQVISFPEASLDWGTVTHFALVGAVERVMLIYGELDVARVIVKGSVPRFEAGVLEVMLN